VTSTSVVASATGVSDRIAARLKALEEAGVIRRSAYQSGPTRFDYQLTESGRALLPVLDALLVWGKDHAVSADDPDRDQHRPTRRWPALTTPEKPRGTS
jgi:DNA-binding HxlR family transcriptional regulator